MSTTASEYTAAPRLERPRDGRMLAGVCAGLARHLNIDPTIVRIGFVVLTVVGGAGVAAYLAALLLIPEEGSNTTLLRALANRRLAIWAGIALLVAGGASLLGALFDSGVADGAFWAALLVTGGALLVLDARGARAYGDTQTVAVETAAAPVRRRGRATRVVAGCMLLAAGIVSAVAAAGVHLGWQETAGIAVVGAGAALVAGSFFGASPWLVLPPLVVAASVGALAAAGVALRGPIGDREFHPALASELPGTYRVAIGQANVDLRDIVLPAGTTKIKVRVGIGDAHVALPAGVGVRVTGHVGAGEVRLPGVEGNGTDVDRATTFPPAPGRPRLEVDANVGVGDIHVVREGMKG